MDSKNVQYGGAGDLTLQDFCGWASAAESFFILGDTAD